MVKRLEKTHSEPCTQRGGQSDMLLAFKATFCLMLSLGLLQYFLPIQKSVHTVESQIVEYIPDYNSNFRRKHISVLFLVPFL